MTVCYSCDAEEEAARRRRQTYQEYARQAQQEFLYQAPYRQHVPVEINIPQDMTIPPEALERLAGARGPHSITFYAQEASDPAHGLREGVRRAMGISGPPLTPTDVSELARAARELREAVDHPAPEPEEPRGTYEPHGRIDTEPVSETHWNNPHHWPSTLERSPWWHRDEQVLQVPSGDSYMTYTREELEEDIRYV